MNKRSFWTRFFLVMTVLTAAAIFFFSSQPGEESSELSDGVTLTVVRIIRPDYASLPPDERQAFLESLGLIVRKCAHFSEFALLGLNVMCLFRLRRRTPGIPRPMPLAAWGASTLYAATDELHQMFVDARGPAFLDVGIDSAGALTGVLLAVLGLSLLSGRIDALE